MYREGDLVEAVIEQIIPSGVFVRLKEGGRAYIRRRELTLSGDIPPRDVVNIGDKVKAKVQEMPTDRYLMELSVRDTLPDPWDGMNKKLHQCLGIVIASVKRIFKGYLSVQVEPGIDGLIPWEELPEWLQDKPGEHFWEGDRIEAEVIYVNEENKTLRLSISRRLSHIAQADAYYEELTLAGKHDNRQVLEQEKLLRGPITLPSPVLIVEEQDSVRESLVNWLIRMNCPVMAFASLENALNGPEDARWSVALIDVGLPDLSDFRSINRLRERGDRFPIAIMSDSGNINTHLQEINTLDLSAVFVKPLDIEDLYHFLMVIAQGNPPRFIIESKRTDSSPESSKFSKVLDSFMKGDGPLTERLQNGLQKLVEDTHAESAILFHLDPVSHKVSLIVSTGSIPLNTSALYRLILSPVKDIIIENGRIYENHILSDTNGRFRNLLALLSFNSCMGVPIPVWGKIEHALFLFHRQEGAFSPSHLHDTLSAATLISSTLERQNLVESLRPTSALLLSGELSALLNHEVFNQLTSINIDMNHLKTNLVGLEKNTTKVKRAESVQQIGWDIQKIGKELNRIHLTAERFRRLEEAGDEPQVDLNKIIEQTVEMVAPMADRIDANIQTELALDLPLVHIPGSIPYHVFLNVILNAIQQMELCPKEQRALTISTRLDDGKRYIQVRFKDTGPGIHKALWQEIFTMGFTTRKGGSGLGLFISKMLLDTIASRITVEDSMIAIGSTFLVEVPVKK